MTMAVARSVGVSRGYQESKLQDPRDKSILTQHVRARSQSDEVDHQFFGLGVIGATAAVLVVDRRKRQGSSLIKIGRPGGILRGPLRGST